MSLVDRFKRLWDTVGGASHPDGLAELQVGDPRFDDWEVVGDFGELETARAFQQSLAERGMESVLTADWPLDEYGRGRHRPARAAGTLERGQRAPRLRLRR